MNTHWMLDTHGDPIGAVRSLVHILWQQAKLDGMLVPFSDIFEANTRPCLLTEPSGLNEFNPFRPLMTINDAKLIPAMLQDHPHERLGVVVRPCEMRALAEMARRGAVQMDHLLTISIDCLGTFPAADIQWRAERKGSANVLDHESLRFARQGGILAYRFRSACQACLTQQAHGADLNIAVLGLPVRQYLLVSAKDGQTASRFNLEALTDGVASDSIISQREKMLAKLNERNARTREHILHGLAGVLPENLDSLVAQLGSCGECQECMQVCPICAVDFPRKGEDGLYIREDILNWLVSCVGCGMCEQACPNHQPLNMAFSYIRQKIEPTRALAA